MSVMKIRRWTACGPQDVWDAFTTPEKFCQFFAPEGLPAELATNPEVHEAFRSSYRKLGRLLGVETENRPCE